MCDLTLGVNGFFHSPLLALGSLASHRTRNSTDMVSGGHASYTMGAQFVVSVFLEAVSSRDK